jgi:hypothetical protein
MLPSIVLLKFVFLFQLLFDFHFQLEFKLCNEQAAIALKNLNNIDQAIDILKRGISVYKNPNPFENKKNLKMLTLLEEFENEIFINEKFENLKNINFELKKNNNVLKTEIDNMKNEINNLKNENNNWKNEQAINK